MAFSEKIKTIVKRKSHFQCCLCKEIGVEIHHVIPQYENGSDTEDNAAPLCPSCHEIYGDNPKKRKFIRDARDLWYEICETRYKVNNSELAEIKNNIDGLATKAHLENYQEQILNAIKEQNKTKISDVIGNVADGRDPDVIKTLDIYDVITYIYHSRSKRQDNLHEIILHPDLWTAEDGNADIRKDFLEFFGYKTAVVIVNRILDQIGIPVNEGITDAEFSKVFELTLIDMVVIKLCAKNVLSAFLRVNGEVSYQSQNIT